jgi:glycosyltransferase involved in cell wall biosynthesis
MKFPMKLGIMTPKLVVEESTKTKMDTNLKYPVFSIVIPLYNEEILVQQLYDRLRNVLNAYQDCEIVCVNDGSTDRTLEILTELAHKDSRLVILSLSRNFGHQAALMAGVCQARPGAIITMDGDLQDPPELIPALLTEWQQGAEVVIAMRRSRQEHGLRRVFFDLFHHIFQWISDTPIVSENGTFGLLGPRATQAIVKFQEHNRYFPGLRNWIGFRQGILWYDRNERASGVPKQSFRRLFKMGFDAIFSFSYKPLRLSLFVGTVISLFSFFYGFVLFVLRVFNFNVVLGFTTVAAAIFFLGGVQLISLGIMGEYLLRVYDETKQRPNFIIAQRITGKGDALES